MRRIGVVWRRFALRGEARTVRPRNALAEHLGTTLLTGDARIAGAPGTRCTVEVL